MNVSHYFSKQQQKLFERRERRRETEGVSEEKKENVCKIVTHWLNTQMPSTTRTGPKWEMGT